MELPEQLLPEDDDIRRSNDHQEFPDDLQWADEMMQFMEFKKESLLDEEVDSMFNEILNKNRRVE